MDDLQEMQDQAIEAPAPPIDDTLIENAIKAVKDKLDQEEKVIRDGMVRDWKYAELMWRGIQNIFWSEIAHDWKTFDDPSLLENEVPNGLDPDEYAQVINIYRAHGESIIAALTVSVPSLRFYPADADKPEDITASKGFTKLSDKIDNDVNASLKLVQILFNLYNFGIAFGYNYHETDAKYGLDKAPDMQAVQSEQPNAQCADCESSYPVEAIGQPCPQCMEMGYQSILQPGSEQVESMEEIGEIVTPKSQECIEVFGPLHVTIPSNLTSIEMSPYLRLEMEHHYAALRALYPDHADKIQGNDNLTDNDRWARSTLPTGNANQTQCTYTRWWLRPSAYFVLEAEDDKFKALKDKYPEGLLAIFINNVFIEARAESLDDHWTVTTSPLSMNLNAQSIGSGVMPIQEMRNELDALTMRTIKNGIPETFADPSVVDFPAYNAAPAEPGLLYKAKAKAGQRLADAFYTNTPSTLSKDVAQWRQQLDTDAQFVSGAYPSVYGGPNDQGSKTASEYDQSRNQALQRLSLAWKMLNVFWADVKRRATLEYRQYITKDQNFVKYQGGSFINVWIRQEEVSGEIGRVESEMSDQFPISWVQIRGLMLQLLGMGNPAINTMLFAPDNIGEMGKALGWTGMVIPGENDRNKQLAEIGMMLKGQMVNIDPMTDNGMIHIEVLKNYLNGTEGLELMNSNPQAYQMIHGHLEMHLQSMMPPEPMLENVNPMDAGQGPAPSVPQPPQG